MVCTTLATRLWWVSITPFERPVVPDEYGSATRSSAETGTCSASGGPNSAVRELAPSASPITTISVTFVSAAAARTVSRSAGTVTTSVASASTSWWCTSRSV